MKISKLKGNCLLLQIQVMLLHVVVKLGLILTLILLILFFRLSAAYIQVHLKLDSFMQAIIQTLIRLLPRKQSDLGPYCLQYRLPKNISR